MAPKKLPLEDPPSASSSAEESEEITDKEDEEDQNQQLSKPSEDEEEGSDEEEEEEEEEEVNNNNPSVPKPTPTKPQSSSESDGSDSDEETNKTSPTASDFTVKPIASKPMGDSTKSKRPTSKSAVVSLPAAKRPAESEKISQRKKAKVSNGGVDDDEVEKKSGGPNTRLWSGDDEVVILKGMVDYQREKGADPNAEMGEFHDFIKESLSVDVSKTQLMDKVRRMKKKYLTNSEKWEKAAFSKPHEHKMFGLSEKIWGGGGASNGVEENGKSSNKRARKSVKVNNSLASPVKVNASVALPKENGLEIALKEEGLSSKIKDMNVKKEEFWSMYPRLKESLEMDSALQKSFMMENMSLIGNAKARELEMKWKDLRMDEIALYLRRVELIQEQTKLVLDANAMKSSEA